MNGVPCIGAQPSLSPLPPLLSLCQVSLWYYILRFDTVYWRAGCSVTWRKRHNAVLDKLEVGLLSDTADDVRTHTLPSCQSRVPATTRSSLP